jgi:acetyl esterase/lipase
VPLLAFLSGCPGDSKPAKITLNPEPTTPAQVPAPPPSPVSVRKQVQYGSGPVKVPQPGQAPLLMDVYRPTRAAGPRPAVIFIHGGGFRSGGRGDPEAVHVAHAFARDGMVTASIDYRMIFQKPVLSKSLKPLSARVVPPPGLAPDPEFPDAVVAAIEDTLKAVQYLRDHARRLGIDPERIGLVGSSAGAITADHIAYVLDDYGIERPNVSFVGSLWGGILIKSRNGGAAVSQLDKNEAALFAAHGEQDPTLPVQMSDDLVARARAQQVPTEYIRMPGAGHDPPTFFTDPVAGDQTGLERLLGFARTQFRP